MAIQNYAALLASMESKFQAIFQRLLPSGIANPSVDFLSWTKRFDAELSREVSGLSVDDQAIAQGYSEQIKRVYAWNRAVTKNEEKRPQSVKSGNRDQLAFDIAEEILTAYRVLTMRDNNDIYVYNSGAYVPEQGQLGEFIEARLGSLANNHIVDEITGHIRRRTFIDRSEFNRDKEWLCVKNGLLNIFTKELRPHTPDFLTLMKLNIEYRPELGFGPVVHFLETSLNPENRRKAIKMFGDILIPDYRYESLYFLLGVGSNGKGTLGRLLKAFLGQQNCSAVRLQDLADDKHARADLFGKMLNFGGDIEAGDLKDWAIVRSLTGGDLIRANPKNRKPFEFTNSAKLVFAFNKLPSVDDNFASYRRLVLIEFDRVFTDEDKDPNFDEKLQTPEAMSGLLNLALGGVEAMVKDSGFNENWLEVRQRYQLLQNEVAQFIEDCCIVTVEGQADVMKVQEQYLEWARKHRKKLLDPRVLGGKLTELGYPNIRSRAKGRKGHYYQGLELRDQTGQQSLT